MTHDELIEKVAQAIYKRRPGSNITPWESLNRDYQASLFSDAKAAISTILAALQEPTEGMLLAAKGFGDTQAWQEMLAASALGEQSE